MHKPSDTPIFVVGHKNPDTDAICSAIGHADLLRNVGHVNAEAIRCGEVPERVAWVLEQASIEAPRLVEDVRATADMLCAQREVFSVCTSDTFLTAYRHMLSASLRSLPVVDDNNNIVGLLKFTELLQLLMPSQTEGIPVKTVHTSLRSAVATLGGESIGADLPETYEEEELVMFVSASSIDTMNSRLSEGVNHDCSGNKIAICGDRPDVQELVIQSDVRGLVVTGGFEVPAHLLELAKEKGIVVISSPLDTASTVQMMRCSRTVQSALCKEFLCVEDVEAITDFKPRLTSSTQDLFPVVKAGTRQLLGVFTKGDLVDPPRNRIVLVDHNEYSQAVRGVDEAQVLEVIDHHRLGGNIVSTEPITYLNEPVGSTCTLVARKYKYRGLVPDRGIALCLCAGLISDTLNLTSPTTTDVDREILEWLCEIAQIDAATFTKGFFEAGSLLLHGSEEDILGVDCKEFSDHGVTYSISQIEEIVIDSLSTRQNEIEKALEKRVALNGYDFAILAVTEISSHRSIILAAGNERILNALPYDKMPQGAWDAPGVVSRKKQILPTVGVAIMNASATELEISE